MSKKTIINVYKALGSKLPTIKEESEEFEDSNEGKKKKRVTFYEASVAENLP